MLICGDSAWGPPVPPIKALAMRDRTGWLLSLGSPNTGCGRGPWDSLAHGAAVSAPAVPVPQEQKRGTVGNQVTSRDLFPK